MLQQSLSHAQRLIHFIAYIMRDALAEIIYRSISLQFVLDILRDEHHGITTILHLRIEMLWGLARTAIYYGDEITGHDQSILTGLLALLANNALLYYIHDLTFIHYLTTNFLPATTYMPEERLLILFRVPTRCPLRL